MRFAPNCNTSPGLAGPVGSIYEDYSVTKDTEEKLTEAVGKDSGKASRDQVLLQATVWEARTVSKLTPEVCEAIRLCSFSSATL